MKLISYFLFSFFASTLVGFAQTVVTIDQVVDLTIKKSPSLKKSDLAILQQKQLLKSSINIPNLEIFFESPTGDFYTGSYTQSFEFPSVYKNQYKIQKQRIIQAEKEKTVSVNDVKFQVHILYLGAQYYQSLIKHLQFQDSLYKGIADNSQRQFDAGQIDFLQKSFALNKYGDLHNELEQTKTLFEGYISLIKKLSGINKIDHVEVLKKNNYSSVLPMANNNAVIDLLKQTEQISNVNIQLQKSKALPGFAFGYFNQGYQSTLFQNRFRVGITLPIWFWQYANNIKAAKTELEKSKAETENYLFNLDVDIQKAYTVYSTSLQGIKYFESTGIKVSEEMIKASKRFFEAGETDYINLLRNISDAFDVQKKYLMEIEKLNKSILELQYLTGQL